MLEEVLADFSSWLADWPDCAAKRWVADNPPTEAAVREAIICGLSMSMLSGMNLVAVNCG